MSGQGGGPPPAVTDRGTGPAPVPGRYDQLAPALGRLTAANPGLMTGAGTNSYLVGTRRLVVVDPGPDLPGHQQALADAAAARRARIGWIVVTHTHPDHAPGAARLAALTGAPVLGFAAREGFAPDEEVGDGFELHGPGFALRAVHTPGHASDHLCWLLVDPGVLLTGDHVMHGSTVVVSPPDGDMAVYLDSLRRVRALGPEVTRLAPGHGRLMEEPGAVVGDLVSHRLAREAKVAAVLAEAGPSTVDELLGRVYDDVTERQLPVARRSLWAHLRKLVADGRARCEPGGAPPGDGDDPELAATWVAVGPTAA